MTCSKQVGTRHSLGWKDLGPQEAREEQARQTCSAVPVGELGQLRWKASAPQVPPYRTLPGPPRGVCRGVRGGGGPSTLPASSLLQL